MNPHLRYLLDTNIISALIRNPQSPVTDRIAHEGEKSVCTSIVVAAELRFGAKKSGSIRLASQVEAILSAIDILPLTKPVDQRYATIRFELEKAGTPIGPNDMLIAAQTLTLDLILITANLREFSRVPGLTVENWLEAQ